MKIIRQTGFVLLIVFYVMAGTNHFINPEFYIPLIPPYFPKPDWINLISGLMEIMFGLMLLAKATRKVAVLGIIAMLVAFLPAHIYMIQQEGCLGSLCVPEWVAWVRLIIVHPLLLFWAWSYRNYGV